MDLNFACKVVVPKTYNASGQVVSENKSTVVTQPKKETFKENASSQSVRKVPTRVSNTLKPVNSVEKTQNGKENQLLLNGLQQKINLLNEVMKSDESSDVKVQMVEQILGFQKQAKLQSSECQGEEEEKTEVVHEEAESQ